MNGNKIRGDKNMKVNAFDLFLKQKRFDLIYKHLYVQNQDNNFVRQAYLESIRAFNNFHEEEPSDNIAKDGPVAFLSRFDALIKSFKKTGFDKSLAGIPVGVNGEIVDGAHRLAIAAALDCDVEIVESKRSDLYDYKFFQNNGMDTDIMDYGALEYVKLNPNAYIVNLQSIIDTKFDSQVEQILEKYGFIYYKKNVDINFNGLVNLKKLSYGSFWDRESWIGTVENGFAGAVYHANNSFGKNPMRIYVFVCEKLADVLAAKSEIRALFNIGNFCVHINDTREEAIALAQTYFNKNSLYMINKRPYQYEDKHFDDMVAELRNKIQNNTTLKIEDFCCLATSIFGIRKSGDLDLFYIGDENIDFYSDDLSDNSDEFKFYPKSPDEILYNPLNYCYYQGIKFVSLNVLWNIKKARNKPGDTDTCKMIKAFQCGKKYRKSDFKVFRKIRDGQKRTLVFFNLIKIHYTKKGHKHGL